ncbi:MAG TPA: hypothetical protein VKT82_34495 [Ktedonobacterales bacterium]|nr:hypothetical protein [Ktedonobacterales bacterium]
MSSQEQEESMKEEAQLSIPPGAAEIRGASWERCLCFTARCQQRYWYVQRDTGQRDLWRIGLAPGEVGWRVAARAPLCPLCGAILLTSAPVTPAETQKSS